MPAEAASFLTLPPEGGRLYAVFDGTVGAVRIDDSSGELTELNRQSTEGTCPCYVSVNASGRYAFVANYASIDPDRQDVPHPHSIGPGPENRFVYVPDLGTDRVAIYRIDFETGTLRLADTPFVERHDGAGPRHFEFHPDGRYAYVINELDFTLTAFEYDPDSGALDELETVTTLPEGYADNSYPAEVRASGRWLYGSNRGHDSIVVFEIDECTGELTFTGAQYDLPEPICMVFADSE